MTPHHSDIVIIGAGLGGLFAGALMAREGRRVTILEKNAGIGGGLQTFTRFGETFDTGMHVIGGMQKGGNVRRICEYLGILPDVDIRPVDDRCTDRLYFGEDGSAYDIAKGRSGFLESLAARFPAERAGLERYVDDIYAITDEVGLFHLRPSDAALPVHSEQFAMPADEFIARHVGDPRLRAVLAYMNPLYGGRENQTPAYVHAIINVLYIEGACRFVGGSRRFADLLAGVVEKAGGSVISGDGVERIEVADRHVVYVQTASGKIYTADRYISAIHPCTLLKLMPEKAFPKAYRDRLNTIPNSYSAFSLYIKMKPETFPYINHSEYFMTRYADIWKFGRTDHAWPLGFLLMTPPEKEQGAYSRKVLVTAPMSFERVRRWENTTVGRRGADYEQWKRERTGEILDVVERVHPGFRENIEKINASSPLTVRDFYGVKEGALSGYSKDYANLALSQLPVVTKVDNLLLTGQNNNLHGFCGVPLTAIQTCEAILGRNVLVNKIAQCKGL